MTTGVFPPSNTRKNYRHRRPSDRGWFKAQLTIKARTRARRDRIASLLANGVDTIADIVRFTGLCERTVRSHIKRIQELNDASLQHHPDP